MRLTPYSELYSRNSARCRTLDWVTKLMTSKATLTGLLWRTSMTHWKKSTVPHHQDHPLSLAQMGTHWSLRKRRFSNDGLIASIAVQNHPSSINNGAIDRLSAPCAHQWSTGWPVWKVYRFISLTVVVERFTRFIYLTVVFQIFTDLSVCLLCWRGSQVHLSDCCVGEVYWVTCLTVALKKFTGSSVCCVEEVYRFICLTVALEKFTGSFVWLLCFIGLYICLPVVLERFTYSPVCQLCWKGSQVHLFASGVWEIFCFTCLIVCFIGLHIHLFACCVWEVYCFTCLIIVFQSFIDSSVSLLRWRCLQVQLSVAFERFTCSSVCLLCWRDLQIHLADCSCCRSWHAHLSDCCVVEVYMLICLTVVL